jgi:hypothetical protein
MRKVKIKREYFYPKYSLFLENKRSRNLGKTFFEKKEFKKNVYIYIDIYITGF